MEIRNSNYIFNKAQDSLCRSDLLVVATEGGAEYQAYYYPASGFGAVVTNKWGGSEQKTNTSYFR